MENIYREIAVTEHIDNIWNFFSNPKNLNEITPPELNFNIITNPLPKMYQGQIIEYRVEFIRGIKSKWITEIAHVMEREYFVDEQRIGPYKFWYHEHIFKKTDKGVKIIDNIHFEVGYGILGEILTKIWIKKRLEYIFDYRAQIIEKKFNK